MGGYRLKSGQSMSSLTPGNLPNLPTLDALSRKSSSSQSLPKASKVDLASVNDASLNANDDFLSEVGGIDGWDTIPDGATIPPSSISDALSDDDEDDCKTSVMQAPLIDDMASLPDDFDDDDDPESITNTKPMIDVPLPTPKSGDNLPSLKSSPNNAGIKPAPNSASTVPSIDDLPSLRSKSSSAIPAAQTASKASEDDASEPVIPPPAPMPEPAPVQKKSEPSDSASTSSKPAVSEKTAASTIPAPQPAKEPQPESQTEEEDFSNLSDEEQFAKFLEAMSPEERAEYEAHCYQMQQEEIERMRAKNRELQEMYGASSINQKKSNPGLIITIIIIIGLFGAGIYLLLTSESPEEQKKDEKVAQENVELPPPPEPVRAPALNTYSVKMNISGANLLFINGVETPIGGSYEFADGHYNTVMAFGDDMVPFFKTFEAEERVSDTIDIQLEPNTLYAKGKIKFRLDNIEQATGLKATFDGHSMANFPNIPEENVVLGRPHILVVEKPGFSKHMTIIWPDDFDTTTNIPALEPEDSAPYGAKCKLKKPKSSKPIAASVTNSGESINEEAVATVLPGGIIEYYITREQRFPLKFAVIPEGFGTVTFDISLLRKSIGEAVVAFTRPKGSDIAVCMRRPGELICPNVNEATTVPSGSDWEFFGIREDTKQPVRGGQAQELQSSRKYTFNVGLNKNGIFQLNQTKYEKINKNK